MSILRRISRMIRAQLGAVLPEAGNEFRREAANTGRSSAADPSARRNSESHHPGGAQAPDPEIAACYANLELPYGADLAAVEKAWKALLRRYHPDLHSGDPQKQEVATALVQGLNAAHERLAAWLKSGQSGRRRR